MAQQLDAADLAILRDCPFNIMTFKGRKHPPAEAIRMSRIKRLWSTGYLSGGVTEKNGVTTMHVALRDAGRAAIGRLT